MSDNAYPRCLTVADVCDIEGVDEKTVRGWIARNELKAHDASRHQGEKPRWRIRPADLEAFQLRRAAVEVKAKPARAREPLRPEGWVEYV
jgi:hypothetical protein